MAAEPLRFSSIVSDTDPTLSASRSHTPSAEVNGSLGAVDPLNGPTEDIQRGRAQVVQVLQIHTTNVGFIAIQVYVAMPGCLKSTGESQHLHE